MSCLGQGIIKIKEKEGDIGIIFTDCAVVVRFDIKGNSMIFSQTPES